MSEIPEDVMSAARKVADEVCAQVAGSADTIARAILAERERCAAVCEEMPTTSGLEAVYANRIRVGWQPTPPSKEPL